MEKRKIVRSTRTYDEHLANIMEYQSLKADGTPDKEIAKRLSVGFSTLQKYKETLASINIESLSSEYLLEKKQEVDTQVEAIVYKVNGMMDAVVKEYLETSNLVSEAIASVPNDDLDYYDRIIRFKKMNKYPSKELAEIMRIGLEATRIRSFLWAASPESKDEEKETTAKSVVINVGATKQDIDKLNRIADSVIGNGT